MNHLNLRLYLLLFLISISTQSISAQSIDIATVEDEIERVKKLDVPDPRTVIFDVFPAETLNEVIILKGETNLPEAKVRLLNNLKSKGVHFTDSIIVLPSAQVGDKIWALGTLSVAGLRSQPSHASELVSQVLMGTVLQIDFTRKKATRTGR